MNISLCIPRVNKMYNNSFIYNTINKYKIGEIEDVAIQKKNFNKYILISIIGIPIMREMINYFNI